MIAKGFSPDGMNYTTLCRRPRLSEQGWLAAERFTAADLLMANVLRVSEVRAFGDRPATEAYVTRATDRTSFKKARAGQLGHFEASDRKRAEERSN